MNFEVQILVPKKDNDNVPFEEKTCRVFERYLTKLFGGFSRYPGQVAGGWVAPDGTYHPDKSWVFGVAIDGLADGEKVIRAARFAKHLFRQKSMFVRYLGQTEFVD